jgi:hypothetical protein
MTFIPSPPGRRIGRIAPAQAGASRSWLRALRIEAKAIPSPSSALAVLGTAKATQPSADGRGGGAEFERQPYPNIPTPLGLSGSWKRTGRLRQ